VEVERGHAWGVPWLCLACPFSVPWLGSLSNPWPVAASISVSSRDIYYYVRVYVFTSVFLLSQGNMPRTWDERGMKWKSHRPADTQKVTAMASAIAQPPWSETASNQNAQLWGGLYLPSRAFNCGTICTAQLQMQVDSLVRFVKCICAYTFAYWISSYQKSLFASLLQLRSMKFNRPLALDGFGGKTWRISQKDQKSERTAEKVD